MRDLDISQVAKRADVPASTLRFYEEKGLIRSIGRRGLRRLFDPSVLERLALIGLGRASGFSLEEIARMFAIETHRGAAVVFRYATTEGKLVYEKYRALDAKRFWRKPAGSTTLLYGLPRLQRCDSERIIVVEGELVLVTDTGEQVLKVGTGAGFPANSGDGHQLINRTDKPAVYLEIGTRDARDEAEYSDIDMKVVRQPRKFVTKSGAPY